MRLALGIIPLLFVSLLFSVPLESATGDDGSSFVESGEGVIYLKFAAFDPLDGEPYIPDQLIGDASDVAMVQFAGSVRPEWRAELAEHSVILTFIKDHTFIVFPLDLDAIRDIPSVRWVGAYHPAYRINRELLVGQHSKDDAEETGEEEETDVSIQLYWKSCDPAIVSMLVEELGGEIIEDGSINWVIQARLDIREIIRVSHLPWVERIEPLGEMVALMDNIREYTGAEDMYDVPFDGSGVVGEVKDNGIDLDHPEFVDQLIGTDGAVSEESHGTSTFGIVFAKGVDERALGMAPGSGGVFCDWGVQRYQSIYNLVNNWDGVFQSNSWYQGSPDSSYSIMSTEDDRAIMDFDVTMLYATGNGGAEQACSQDAVAKNVIAVGGIRHGDNTDWEDDRHTGGQGNRGPADDGRIKPDLCGPYESIYTTRPGSYTSSFGGTSGATPVNAGAISLIYQMYEENHFGNNPFYERPHASTVKALAIANAHQYDMDKVERFAQGWGHVDVGTLYSLGKEQFIVNEEYPLIWGGSENFTVKADPGQRLKISLVWTDVPGSTASTRNLINDLDLTVVSPSGVTYSGNFGLNTSKWSSPDGDRDDLNNVENVFIETPEAGEWDITVSAQEIVMDADLSTLFIDQPFSLVVSGRGREQQDLLVFDHQFPDYFEPYKKAEISGIVANFGEEDASDVTVELLVNGQVVDTSEIGDLLSDAIETVRFHWTPKGLGDSGDGNGDRDAYELRIHVLPMDEEGMLMNNWYNETIRVFYPLGKIVIDLNHTTFVPLMFLQELTDNDFQVHINRGTIDENTFDGMTAFMTFDPDQAFTEQERNHIEEFVRRGGGLLAVAGENGTLMEDLTAFAGVGWSTTDGLPGTTNEIEVHEITENVDSLNFEISELTIVTTGNAMEVVRDESLIFSNVLCAVSVVEQGQSQGHVVALSDTGVLGDDGLYDNDNLIFGLNIADWINDQPPMVFLESPIHMNAYSPELPVNFTSAVVDPDSTDPADLTYSWSSDIAGFLGDEPAFFMNLERGIHEIRLDVSDNLTNGTGSLTIIMNTTQTVSLENPANGSFLQGTVDLEWEIVDPEDDPLAFLVEIRSLDSQELHRFDNLTLRNLIVDVDTLTVGKYYSWRVRAVDPYGRIVWSEEREFRYDNNPTEINLLGPADEKRLPWREVSFSWEAHDLDGDDLSYRLYARGSTLEMLYMGNATSFISSPLVQGMEYLWWVEVDDGYDLTESGKRRFQMNSLPVVESFMPWHGQRLANSSVNISLVTEDAEGGNDADEDEVSIDLYLDGATYRFANGLDSVDYELFGLDHGPHIWSAVLDDGYDKVSYGPWNFSLNHDPIVELLGPLDHEVVDNTITLEWHGEDSDNDTIRYYVYLGSSDSQELLAELYGTEYSHFLYPGSYSWYVIAEDIFGRIASEVSTFTVPPGIAPDVEIEFVSPNPALASERISFSAFAEDSDGTIETIEWYSDVDDVLSNSLEFETSGLSVGTHAITLRVMDNEGNVGVDNFTLIILDRYHKSPRAVFVPPPSPFVINSDIRFSFQGSYDSDGTISEHFIDFGDGQTSGWMKSPVIVHSYSSQGSYTLLAKVRDNDGLESRNVVKVSITVQEKPTLLTDDDEDDPMDLLFSMNGMIVIGLSVLLILCFVMWRKGKKGSGYLNVGTDGAYYQDPSNDGYYSHGYPSDEDPSYQYPYEDPAPSHPNIHTHTEPRPPQ